MLLICSLGVGASVPAPTNIRSLESAKLKGKLIGKKRHHDDDPILISSNSEEEGESRAGAIKKKARIDPFESKKSKGKGKKKVETSPPPKAQPSATTKIKSGLQNSTDTKGKAAMSAFSVAIAEPMISPRVTSPESPPHKKRKRKNKPAVTTAVQVEPSSSKKNYSAKDDAIVEVIMVQDSPGMRSLCSPQCTFLPVTPPEPMSPAPKRNRLNTPDPMRSPKSVDRDNIDGPTLFGVPLLNLGGPPPAVETTPSKKKRRRKKKKRAHKLTQGTGGDAMDVDDQEVVIIVPSGTGAPTEPYPSKCRVL